MKRILLIALIAGLLAPLAVFADRDMSVGVSTGFGIDTFADGKFNYSTAGLAMNYFMGNESLGLVSQGMIIGVPLSAKLGNDTLDMADYDLYKIAQSMMLGLAYRTKLIEKVRVQGALGLGLHQTFLMTSDYNLDSVGTILAIGPAVGIDVSYLINDTFHVGIASNFNYALAQLINSPVATASPFKNGISGNVGLVIGFKY